MSMRFNVTITRTSYQSKDFEVEAPDRHAAAALAMDDACNAHFGDDDEVDANYEIDHVEIIDDADDEIDDDEIDDDDYEIDHVETIDDDDDDEREP